MKKSMVFMAVVLFVLTGLFTSCQFVTNDSDLPENNLTDLSGKALDLAIINNIFPEGLADDLDDQLEEAGVSKSRNGFSTSEYVNEDGWGTPDVEYGESSGVIRIPADEEEYLVSADNDPTEGDRYFTMEKMSETVTVGEEEMNVYKITFHVIKPETSSLERTETVYYVPGNDWSDDHTSAELTTSGWETERVYYDNGKVGDRTMIQKWEGEDAKDYFLAPDYGPFDDDEDGVDAIFTIDTDELYGDSSLDEFFQEDYWNGLHKDGTATYSSFVRSLVYADEDDIGTPSDAISEQNDYYTEVGGIKYFPEILDMNSSDRGSIRAGITYYMRPSDEVAGILPLDIVTADSKYFDDEDQFLLYDVKSFQHAAESTYQYVYHYKKTYFDDGTLKYDDTYNYYEESVIDTLRADGEDSYDMQIDAAYTYDGGWVGNLAIAAEDTSETIFLSVRMVGGYPVYSALFNDDEFDIEPDVDGNVYVEMPGGGTLEGSIDEYGTFHGVYRAADGEETVCGNGLEEE